MGPRHHSQPQPPRCFPSGRSTGAPSSPRLRGVRYMRQRRGSKKQGRPQMGRPTRCVLSATLPLLTNDRHIANGQMNSMPTRMDKGSKSRHQHPSAAPATSQQQGRLKATPTAATLTRSPGEPEAQPGAPPCPVSAALMVMQTTSHVANIRPLFARPEPSHAMATSRTDPGADDPSQHALCAPTQPPSYFAMPTGQPQPLPRP